MSLTLDLPTIEAMEKRTRANLINSLSGYKSANLLGSVNSKGQTNLALMSSVFHVGASPALMGVLIRPHSVPRHSLENLLETGVFTLNVVTADIHAQAHQTSARYASEQSEFAAVGLSEQYSPQLIAPYVAQSPIKTGLSVVETQTLSVNDTVLVIAEIIEVRIDEGLMAEDGQLDMNAAGAAAITGMDEYHTASSLGRQAYAKP